MEPSSFVFCFVLGFLWFSTIFDFYISWRQYKVLNKKSSIPLLLKDHFTDESFEKSRLYEIRNYRFSFLKSIYDLIFNTITLIILLDFKIFTVSQFLISAIGLDSSNQIYCTLIFLTIESILLHILNIPWSLYKHFVIEEEFGFNKLTLSFYFKDSFKSLLLKMTINNIIFTLILKVILITGQNFYFYASAILLAFQIFFLTIYQDYIAPLFDKFIPMSAGTLKDQIDKLALQQRFPLKDILVIEGSKRSAHSNAYFIGLFGKKTIVLFDTLLEHSPFESLEKEKNIEIDKDQENNEQKVGDDSNNSDHNDATIEKSDDKENKQSEDKQAKITLKQEPCTNDEILAILAHELGHWKYAHIFKNISLSVIQTTVTFYIFSFFLEYAPIYEAFGFKDDNLRPIIIGLSVVMQYILGPLNIIIGFLMTYLSRKFEYQADFFSHSLGFTDHLITSLSKLQVNNLSYPIYDNIYSLLNHSHPPILERLNNLVSMKKKNE